MSLKELIKQKLSDSTLRKLRRYDRIRWMSKLQILRTFGFNIWANPRVAVNYVLTDPELESFTYDIENTGELAVFLAELLGEPVGGATALIREAVTDSVLRRDRGWSWSVKRRTSSARARLGMRDRAPGQTGRGCGDGHPSRARFGSSPPGASAQRRGRVSRPADFVRCL